MKIDENEKKFRNRKKFKKVDEILEEEFGSTPPYLGKCHQIWARKKQLLKEMYGINWQSPAELNPHIIFD